MSNHTLRSLWYRIPPVREYHEIAEERAKLCASTTATDEKWGEINALACDLDRARAENHFAQRLSASMGRRTTTGAAR